MSNTYSPQGIVNTNLAVTHLYGRAHATRQRSVINTITVPVNFEFYCDPNIIPACNITTYSTLPSPGVGNAISPSALQSPDDIRWYIQARHNLNVDGNVTNTQTRDGAHDLNFAAISSGSNTVQYIYNGAVGHPYKATIELWSQEWLIYDRYNPNNTVNNGGNVVNNFELEFTRSGVKGGIDNTDGQTSDSNAATNTNRRIQW